MDDASGQMVAPKKLIAARVLDFLAALRRHVEEGCCLPFNMSKAKVVVKCDLAARALKPTLKAWGIKLVNQIKLLGVATTAGLSRGTVTWDRIAATAARVPRCRRLLAGGGKTAGLVKVGLNKQQAWGAGVMGVSDKQLEAMRKTVAKASFGPLPGNLDLKLCAAGKVSETLDPAFELTLAPLHMWAQAVHLAGRPGEASRGLLKKALQAALEKPKARTAGPTKALLQALSRIGWHIVDEVTWLTDDGVLLDLQYYSPAYIGRVARVSRWRWVSRRTALSTGRPDLKRGFWRQPMRDLMRRAPRVGPA